MLNKSLFTSNNDVWNTPQDLFYYLNNIFDFTLDPCTNGNNSKCAKFYTEETNGLDQPWNNETVFCNPPYSDIKKWTKKML